VSDDDRKARYWGIEDSSTGVAGLVHGNRKTAEREAFKLAEYKGVPATIYKISGNPGANKWDVYGYVTP
jgi:hypothetical protein